MKIKIDKHGYLAIGKCGMKMEDQTCPYLDDPCGTWCPLFGEPESATVEGKPGKSLRLCRTRLWAADEDWEVEDEINHSD